MFRVCQIHQVVRRVENKMYYQQMIVKYYFYFNICSVNRIALYLKIFHVHMKCINPEENPCLVIDGNEDIQNAIDV